MKVCIPKSMWFSKSGIKRKVCSNTSILQETRIISNNLTLNLSEKSESVKSLWFFVMPRTVACQALPSMAFPRQEYWSGLPFPSPGDLPNQGLSPGLPRCRWILYHLSHEGSPVNIYVNPNLPIHPTSSSPLIFICFFSISVSLFQLCK